MDELTAAHEELTDLYNEQVRQAQAREREVRYHTSSYYSTS